MGKAMGGRKYARKRDENELGIVLALEMVGATVVQLDKPVDLLVGFRGIDFQMEVKNGKQPKSWQRITPDQAEHIQAWQGREVAVVTSIDHALKVIGIGHAERRQIIYELSGGYDEFGRPGKKRAKSE